jgi:hypothetical protein
MARLVALRDMVKCARDSRASVVAASTSCCVVVVGVGRALSVQLAGCFDK